jgi:hypothetical protein
MPEHARPLAARLQASPAALRPWRPATGHGSAPRRRRTTRTRQWSRRTPARFEPQSLLSHRRPPPHERGTSGSRSARSNPCLVESANLSDLVITNRSSKHWSALARLQRPEAKVELAVTRGSDGRSRRGSAIWTLGHGASGASAARSRAVEEALAEFANLLERLRAALGRPSVPPRAVANRAEFRFGPQSMERCRC